MAKDLAAFHPSQPEPDIPPFNLSKIPDTETDHPDSGLILPKSEAVSGDELNLPPVILGTATFGYGIYDSDSGISSDMPLRVVRMALRAGINAFDSAPHYHPSEIITGNALYALRNEYPRSSYKLITKAGRYGSKQEDIVYEPEVIFASVERSLKRFKTDYLDVVCESESVSVFANQSPPWPLGLGLAYLHDPEYATTHPNPSPAGYHLEPLHALQQTLSSSSSTPPTDPNPTNPDPWHLQPPFNPLGSGDLKILSSLKALRTLQSQGKIKKVGIAGYPLPLLLRLALMIKAQTGIPLDIVQSYAHQTIANSILTQGYLDALNGIGGVGQVVNAAPLSMGFLTTGGGPDWHPGRGSRLDEVVKEAVKLCEERGTKLEVVATEFGFRKVLQGNGRVVPVVIGCKNLEEVQRTLESFASVRGNGGGGGGEKGGDGELGSKGSGVGEVVEEVRGLFRDKGVDGWSWSVNALPG